MKEERYKKKTPFRKFVLFFLLISFSCFNVMAQEKNESINMQCNNERLTDALKRIEKMSDYKIIFSYSELQSIRVNATIKDATAPAAVKILLTGQPLTSTVDGKYIRIFSDTKKGLSQKGFFTGKVIDESGEPLPGVSIRLKNSNMGVLSDANGTFRIPAHGTQSYDFVFTFIGKRTLEKKLVEGRGQIITLEDFVNAIDEVVVTGYQTVNRRESASAISTIAAKDIMVDGASTIDQMLQGKIPGMAVMNTSGEPSATPKIRIRGNATINGNKAPVWVVDGVILEQNVPFNASDINSGDAEYLIGNAISGLNPQDIETITVLKDASATAIYGVKAANGVIVITTKKGHYGKPTITYNGDITINTRPSYSNYNLMNSQQRVEFSKQLVDAGQQFGRTPVGETYEGAYEDLLAKTITLDQFRTKVDAMQVRNTNWFKYLFRNNITHNHTANISGGSDNLRYYMSAGFSDVEGSAKKSDSRRFNSIARVDALINKHINFQAKINFSTTSNKGYSSVNPFNYAYNTTRTIPAYNDDGSYYMVYAKAGYSGTKNVGYNVLKELDTTGQSSKMDNFDALFRLNINVFDGLKYEGTFSWSNGNTASRNWATDQSYYIGANYRGFDYGKYTAYDSEYWDSELPYGGILSQSHTRKTGYTIRNQVQYNKVFNQDHAIDLVGGIEARRNAYKGDSQTGYGWTPEFGEKFNPVLTSSYISYILEAGNTNPSNTNSFTQVASYYGIASYAYKERYVLNANIRSDGSNKFGSNPKYRWLPTYSFAVKWNMMNENFMKQMKWIDVFSFRGSYGIQGNISENDSPYLILKVGNRDNILGLPKSTISKLPNPDLRWEKTRSWDAALDFSFLNGRIRGSLDFYGKHTKDLIISKVIPSSNGTTAMDYNIGRMTNKGFEGFINAELYRDKDWVWRAGFNFGRNINKITYANDDDLSQVEIMDKMLAGNMAVQGAPIGSMYAYHFAGINQDIGYPMFYTKDGRESIEGSKAGMELVRKGTIFPKLTGGFDTELRYKNLSLSMTFTYSLGSVDRIPNYFTSGTIIDPLDNVSKEWLQCWKKSGDDTVYPAPYNSIYSSNYLATEAGSKYNTYDKVVGANHAYSYDMYNYSDIRIAKADFLKLKLLSLQYIFPQKMLTPLRIKSLRMRLQATNLFTIADKMWHGLDPETGGYGIPSLPTYSMSVNVSF